MIRTIAAAAIFFIFNVVSLLMQIIILFDTAVGVWF